MAAAILLLLIGLMVVFGPLISGYPITESTNALTLNQRPSWSHWFGTDTMGRTRRSRARIG